MFSLIWDIEDLKQLYDIARKLRTEISTILDVFSFPRAIQQEYNLSRKLGFVRSKLMEVLKGLYSFKRTPATHIFVYMISSALRNRKPYALPVQCVPYSTLTERDMRRMVNGIVAEMVSHGMKVAGKHLCIIISLINSEFFMCVIHAYISYYILTLRIFIL